MLFFFRKFIDYKFLILFILVFNEYTLSFFDKTPPLSDNSLINIRKIQVIYLIIFFYLKFIFLNNEKIKLHHKILKIFKRISYAVVLIILFDQTLKFVGFGIDDHWYDEDEIRFESPYDMFSNKPNIYDHNIDGFRGPLLSQDINDEYFTIAFFGGSTGYSGNPPIPEILGINLFKNNIKNIIFNFSSNSSNHNQHIHRLIKFFNYKFDLVIFYGGNNESIQHLQYDPRPGYPYNFYMKNELSELKIFLLKYSAIIGMLEKYTGIVTGITNMKTKLNYTPVVWHKSIVNNYLNNINLAGKLVKKNIEPNKCFKTYFMPILQPVNPINLQQQILWDKIIDASNNIDNLKNYNILRDNITFFDNVHIDQSSKPIIADKMTEDIKKIYDINCK